MWFDALVYTTSGLRHLVDTVGAEQVTLGTDYPFDMGVANPVERVANAFDEPELREAICSRSAAGLFGPRLPMNAAAGEGLAVSTSLHDHDAAAIGNARVEDLGGGLYAYIQPDGSWMINNTGFLVGHNGVTAIDSCSTEQRTQAFRTALAAVTADPVRVLVNTHSHPDHTTGNALFGEAAIVAHEGTRAEVLAMATLPPAHHFWEPFEGGTLPVAPPFLTYRESMTLWIDDLRCELRHVGRAAHTTNDSILWIPERSVLYAGDLLFNGGTPFLMSGSVIGAIQVLTEQLVPLGAATIVPGHGPVCGSEVIELVLGYLRFVVATAEDAQAAGLTPLEAACEIDLGEYAAWTDRTHCRQPTPGLRRSRRRTARLPLKLRRRPERHGDLQRRQAPDVPRLTHEQAVEET